ncbi:hypothetical protein QYF36_019597 [Acer negundo]|nr:hypothetical protein QYF36_019597 [Acer negundo]
MDGHEGQAQSSGFYFNGLCPVKQTHRLECLIEGDDHELKRELRSLFPAYGQTSPLRFKGNGIESYMRSLNSRYLKILKLSTHSDMYVGPVDVALDKMTAGPSSPIFYGLIRNEDQNLASLSFEFFLIFFIPQVPIVKCIVENIAVDIFFNRLGGLCALCFLEETLVLYIFHAFDNSFAGPLEVFSKFDWDNFYVSICSAVDPPRRDRGELLLSESIYAYIAAYTVLPLGQRNPDFKLKCFNIIDPLLWNKSKSLKA